MFLLLSYSFYLSRSLSFSDLIFSLLSSLTLCHPSRSLSLFVTFLPFSLAYRHRLMFLLILLMGCRKMRERNSWNRWDFSFLSWQPSFIYSLLFDLPFFFFFSPYLLLAVPPPPLPSSLIHYSPSPHPLSHSFQAFASNKNSVRSQKLKTVFVDDKIVKEKQNSSSSSSPSSNDVRPLASLSHSSPSSFTLPPPLFFFSLPHSPSSISIIPPLKSPFLSLSLPSPLSR